MLVLAAQVRFVARDYAGAPDRAEAAVELSDEDGLASALHVFGMALTELEGQDGARQAFERALALREAIDGPAHPDTAQTMQELAALYVRAGRSDLAEALMDRALRVVLQVNGGRSVPAGAAWYELAAIHRDHPGDTAAAALEARIADLSRQLADAGAPARQHLADIDVDAVLARIPASAVLVDFVIYLPG